MKKASRPWHPVIDGIAPIINAIEQLEQTNIPGLADSLTYTSTRPSYELQDGMMPGTAPSFPEMVRRWLQFNGFSDDAKELNDRISRLFRSLRIWEEETFAEVQWRRSGDEDLKWDRMEPIEKMGEKACEGWNAMLDEGARTRDYLQQLASMMQGKLNASQHMGESNQSDPGLSDPMPRKVIAARLGVSVRQLKNRKDCVIEKINHKLHRIQLGPLNATDRAKFTSK